MLFDVLLTQDFSLAKCMAELSRNPPVQPEAFEAFLQKRYEAAAAAFDAAQQQHQKRKAAAAAAAAATENKPEEAKETQPEGEIKETDIKETKGEDKEESEPLAASSASTTGTSE